MNDILTPSAETLFKAATTITDDVQHYLPNADLKKPSVEVTSQDDGRALFTYRVYRGPQSTEIKRSIIYRHDAEWERILHAMCDNILDVMLEEAKALITDDLRAKHPKIDFQRPELYMGERNEHNGALCVEYEVYDGDSEETHWTTLLLYDRDARWDDVVDALHEDMLSVTVA